MARGVLKHKQKVTLTLNKEVYARAREFVNGLPGNPSVSSLVDEVLDAYLTGTAPLMDAVKSGDEAAQIETLKRLYGEMSTALGLEFGDTIRAMEAQAKKGDSIT